MPVCGQRYSVTKTITRVIHQINVLFAVRKTPDFIILYTTVDYTVIPYTRLYYTMYSNHIISIVCLEQSKMNAHPLKTVSEVRRTFD